MANTKIQRVKANGTTYDIDLPSDATIDVSSVATDSLSVTSASTSNTYKLNFNSTLEGLSITDGADNEITFTPTALEQLYVYDDNSGNEGYYTFRTGINGVVATLDDIPSTSDFVTLSGTQTVSGQKTFSGVTYFTGRAYHNGAPMQVNYTGSSSDATLQLTDNRTSAAASSTSAVYTYMLTGEHFTQQAVSLWTKSTPISSKYYPTATLQLFAYDNLGYGSVQYSGNNIIYNPADTSSFYTYTFPTKTGTFAMTSDLTTLWTYALASSSYPPSSTRSQQYAYISKQYNSTVSHSMKICTGYLNKTTRTNDAAVAVTFPSSFYGTPQVIVMPLWGLTTASGQDTAYRNTGTVRCFRVSGTNTAQSSISYSSTVNGFVFDPGCSESWGWMWIAIGYAN